MGKIKTKYPLEIQLDFMLFLESSELIRENYSCVLQSGDLEYPHLDEAFRSFLGTHGIAYQAYMFFQGKNEEGLQLVQTNWRLNLRQIEQHNRYIGIVVKSHTQHMQDLLLKQLDEVHSRLQILEDKMERQPSQKEEEPSENKITIPVPMLHHASSITQPFLIDKDLDIGVLFSEPLFDQKRNREANLPVDFRSQLQRLQSALNNSYKPEITLDCQIATKQHLKHLIAYKKPKILHIICHGSREGQLQFQDDSKYAIGQLSSISADRIRDLLKGKKENMPQLVFINSCHSQIIGKIFFQAGAKYCIMIDSQDKIDDQAAQIFSQNFYRNIFRGQKVGMAFKQAQDNVKIKHNSSGCCCRHTSREVHKPNCRWLQLCTTMGEQEAHRIYHIPSQKCTCELRNLNQHELKCEWAQFSLYHINNDFRIKDGADERFPKKKSQLPKYLPSDGKNVKLLICCCFNFEDNGLKDSVNTRIPHSESNKFKMLPEDMENTDCIYDIQKNIAFRTQVISMTAPELIEHHQRVQNSTVLGRQQQLYFFMKNLQDNQYNTFFVYGFPGVGKTTFAIKAATYLLERQIFHIYYFVDLFGIRDRDMFRNKFNEVTNLNYPFNYALIKELNSRKIIIILDNIDEFFMSSMQEFQDEIQLLKNQFQHIKIILTCKQKNISTLDTESFYTDNRCLRRQLNPLDENTAAKAFFSKIRNYLDISVSYMDIREIVGNTTELRIPKMIENLSHSFSQTKGKVKLNALLEKVKQIGKGDLAFNKLIEENLNLLKVKCKESYDMLIFISQFSQGIEKNDFNILGTYDRSENKGHDSSVIDIPIDRNWKKRLAVLFEQSDVSGIDSESQSTDTPGFQRRQTQFNPDKAQISNIVSDEIFESDSYFLEELSRNRFVVRRFIRDFIWNKDKSDENFYMKHIFVAYTAVMLDIYLTFLVSEKYIHESLIEYTDISKAGIFKFKDNNYFQISLTESVRYVEDYNSRFEKILKQQHALREKIKNSDPSVFILNHKLDFLHIYGYDWSKIYEYLYQNRRKEASVLINYLQRLIILIPTAMKVAGLEESLRKYAIRQSIQLLAQIRKYSKPSHNLMLTLKLKLMRTSEQVEQNNGSLLINAEFQKDFHMNDLKGIDPEILKSIQDQFYAQIQVLDIYQQLVKAKQYTKSIEMSTKTSERILETIRKVTQWAQQKFHGGFDCEILEAKRKTILCLIFLKVTEASLKYPTNTRIQQFKNNTNLTSYVKRAKEAAEVFQIHNMTKLKLRAKLVALSINWQQLKTKVKQYEFSREVESQRTLLRECEEIYEDKRNNLIGLTIFDAVLKKVKKQMKDKIWQESANNIVMLRAVPLSNKNAPILQNVVRKRQKFRKSLQDIFRHAKIDISVKFEILTVDRLEQQTKRQSNILFLNTTFRIQGGKVMIVCQDHDLTEIYIEINHDFVKKYKLQNTKLLILMGPNSSEAFENLEKLFPKSPSILSVNTGSTAQFDDFDDLNYEGIFDKNSTQELKKTIEHNNRVDDSKIKFAMSFIQSLINPKNYQNINCILEDLRHSCMDIFVDFKIKKRQCDSEIIKMSKGSFKDLSPGFRMSHNIDLEFEIKNSSIPCVYRKWKEINEVFRYFSSKQQTKYMQVLGSNGVGKSTFIQEVGRMCIERGLFENGLYIIDGKKVGQNFQSDFEAYITKMSESSGMFTLNSFNKYADSNFLLIIDDFHTIKPRSNGRYNLFINKLLQKKANVMFVTHETFSLKELFKQRQIDVKKVKLQKMQEVELSIFAYNLFKPTQEQAIDEFEKLKKTRSLTCGQIANIYEKDQRNASKYNNYVHDLPQDALKKMTSNFN